MSIICFSVPLKSLKFDSDSDESQNSLSDLGDSISSISSEKIETIFRLKRETPLMNLDKNINNDNVSITTFVTATTDEPTISLTEIIRRIQETFFKTTKNIVQTFRNLTLDDSVSISSDEINKRDISSVDNINNESMTSDIETQSQIIPITEKIPINIDKIAIYPSVGYFPMLPTFDYHLNPRSVKNEMENLENINASISTIKESANLESITAATEENENKITINPSTKNSLLIQTTTVISSENEMKILREIPLSSELSIVDIPSSSLPPSLSSSAKYLIEQIQQVKNEVKEKVTEIESEPIMIPSRA